jgi:Septum formation
VLGRVLPELNVPTRARVLVGAAAVLALVAAAGGIVFALQRSDVTESATNGTKLDAPTPELAPDRVGSVDVVPDETARQEVTVDKLHVGDCVNDLLYPDVVVVPCSAAHQGEIVGVLGAPRGPYPGEELLVESFSPQCEAMGADYIGRDAVSDEKLYVVPEVPYAADWDLYGRRIVCSAFSILKEPMRESIRA